MLKYGFYDSIHNDRTYDAEDMGQMFNGIIRDGVFFYSGEHLNIDDNKPLPLATLEVNDPETLGVNIAPGRAWFNGTWTELSRDNPDLPALFLSIDSNSGSQNRYDFVVLIIDKRPYQSARINSIRILKNSPAYGDGDPDIYTYVLAKITVPPNVGYISSQNIELYTGRATCTFDGVDYPAAPWVTAPLEMVDIQGMFDYWRGQTDLMIDLAISDYFDGLTVATKPGDLGGGYAVCSTAENVLAKTASIDGFKLTNGGLVAIRFNYNVSAGSTLNISGTGARYMYKGSSPIGNSVIRAGDIVTFAYDSTNSHYRILAIDGMYRRPATGIPYSDLNTSLLQDIAKGTTAYQKPADGIPEEDLDASVQAKLNSGGSGQGATFIHMDYYDGGYYPDTTSAQIYAALQLGDVNYVLIDASGRYCLMVEPPDDAVTGQAKFAAIKEDGSELIIYTFAAGSSSGYAIVTNVDVGQLSWNDIKPVGGIPASDLASDVQSSLTAANSAVQPSDLSGYQLKPTVVTVTGNTPAITGPSDNTIYDCTGGEITSVTVSSYSYGNSFTLIFNSPISASAPSLTLDSRITLPDDFQVETNKHYEINVDFKGFATVQSWTLVD